MKMGFQFINQNNPFRIVGTQSICIKPVFFHPQQQIGNNAYDRRIAIRKLIKVKWLSSFFMDLKIILFIVVFQRKGFVIQKDTERIYKSVKPFLYSLHSLRILFISGICLLGLQMDHIFLKQDSRVRINTIKFFKADFLYTVCPLNGRFPVSREKGGDKIPFFIQCMDILQRGQLNQNTPMICCWNQA